MSNFQSGKKLREQPRGLMRWFLRIPIGLYRLRLGWLLGNRFIMVQHIGRKSGKTRYTVLEVVQYRRAQNIYTVVSGWGTKSDWYRNIVKTPAVFIWTYKGKFKASAEVLTADEGAKVIASYAQKHPVAFRSIGKMFLGSDVDMTDLNYKTFVTHMPAMQFLPE